MLYLQELHKSLYLTYFQTRLKLPSPNFSPQCPVNKILVSLIIYSFLIHLLRGLRSSVLEDRAETYAREFFINYYRDDKNGVPQWIKNALAECKITL